MDSGVKRRGVETAAHGRLKRLAVLWAQAQGYSACAIEVTLPSCRYRADVVAYRPEHNDIGSTAVFECKQALADLRRNNCQSEATRERLETVHRRRQLMEKHLRIHFPNLRIADSLFPEFDSHDFAAIQHRGYARVLRELSVLQHRLYNCTKFDKLIRYRCANLFFLVVPKDLFRASEIPIGWGALVESNGELALARKPASLENSPEIRLRLLHRIAAAGTRVLNRQLQITFDDVVTERCRSC
ncbi:MAG: hypothetical protein ABI925_00360 [Verrucomicrobiota bacterium]